MRSKPYTSVIDGHFIDFNGVDVVFDAVLTLALTER
jgi:hypothetical protein